MVIEKALQGCKNLGGIWEGKKDWKYGSGCIINDVLKINRMTENTEHIGTYFISGGGGLKTKTFNAYKKNGVIIVTNHYGIELVNAKIFPNEEEFKKDYGKIAFRKYSIPLFPK